MLAGRPQHMPPRSGAADACHLASAGPRPAWPVGSTSKCHGGRGQACQRGDERPPRQHVPGLPAVTAVWRRQPSKEAQGRTAALPRHRGLPGTSHHAPQAPGRPRRTEGLKTQVTEDVGGVVCAVCARVCYVCAHVCELYMCMSYMHVHLYVCAVRAYVCVCAGCVCVYMCVLCVSVCACVHAVYECVHMCVHAVYACVHMCGCCVCTRAPVCMRASTWWEAAAPRAPGLPNRPAAPGLWGHSPGSSAPRGRSGWPAWLPAVCREQRPRQSPRLLSCMWQTPKLLALPSTAPRDLRRGCGKAGRPSLRPRPEKAPSRGHAALEVPLVGVGCSAACVYTDFRGWGLSCSQCLL